MPADDVRLAASPTAFLLGLVPRATLASVAALMLIASLTEGVGLLLLVPIVQVVAGGSGDELGRWSEPLSRLPLAVLLAGFVGLIALRAAIMYGVMQQRSAMGYALTRRLRVAVQRAIVGAEWRWLSSLRSADYGSLIVSETDRVGAQVDRALDLATAAITLAALLAAAFWLSWQLTLITLAFGAATALAWVALRRREAAQGEPFVEAHQDLLRLVSEGLTHLRAARIAGASGQLIERFDRSAARIETLEQSYHASINRAHFVLQVLAAAVLALLVWLALRVLHLPLAVFVPVLAIFARLVPLITAMQEGWRSWRFCRPAVAALMSTIDRARAAAEPSAAADHAMTLRRVLALNGVTCRFAGRARPVFAHFSATIEAGSVVAVSGPSGSGKSTFADLVSGLLVPNEGSVSVDGQSLEGEARIAWRYQVAYVEQMPYLFDGTVAENVAWGTSGADRAAVEEALRAASAQFVIDLQQGPDTVVGEAGRTLSGGERQRIALARALLRRPSLLILDEVTAALDNANERAIAATIERLRGTMTIIILAHRPALLALADHVIELAGDD